MTRTTARARGAMPATVAPTRPRWQSPLHLAVNVRPAPTSHDVRFAKVLGCSPALAHRIRVYAPHWVAALIRHYRETGAERSIATVMGPIDAAGAWTPDLHATAPATAVLEAFAAEQAATLAAVRYLIDGEPARKRLLTLAARARAATARRDALLRELDA